jgi:hypothetical protein
MGTLIYIGEFRLGWKVPSSPKKYVAKSERFPQKSLAHQPRQLSKKICREIGEISPKISRPPSNFHFSFCRQE